MVEIKFCGLTRAADAARALEFGAAYAGAIFAGGPREVTPDAARRLFEPLVGTTVRRVGVFGAQRPDELLRIADEASLDVLQFTDGVELDTIVGLRARFAGALWPVARLQPGARVVGWADDAFDAGVDAIVLDAFVPGARGGTGVTLDWRALGGEVARLRRRGTVVLAGGLRAENVAEAVALAGPDVVDVSSGVESAPGIKDPERMRAFAAAARALEV